MHCPAMLKRGGVHDRELAALARPYNGEDLAWHKVAPAMGRIQCQGPECSAELKVHDIADFFQRPGAAARSYPSHILAIP